MEIFPLLFWLLLLGAVVCVAFVRLEKRWGWQTAVSLLGLSLIAWLILRAQLPLNATFFSWSQSGFLPDWTWRIDATSWNITFWLLLVATAVSLHTFLTQSPQTSFAPANVLLLTAAALTVIWSDRDRKSVV